MKARVHFLDGHNTAPELLGGKGAALDRLVGWGLPVPPTAVVTTTAAGHLTAESSVAALIERQHGDHPATAEEVDAVFVAVEVPEALAAEIVAAARRVGEGRPLAIRSSATVEDLAASSFAGQYRSVLEVDPSDSAAVLDAVRSVWASLWHPAPCAYRRAFGIDDADAAMAVVMMQMVPAELAGVVFTVDPGGRPDAARVETVHGLGESLVSGERTPEAHVVARGRTDGLPAPAAEALELALEIEARAGCAQDVEWAWDGRTWIVQARPITVSEDGDGFDSEPDEHELTTEGIGEMLPGVLPPLVWQLSSHLVNEAFARVLGELGLPIDGTDPRAMVRRVRGRAALDFAALRGVAATLPGNAAAQLEHEYFGTGADETTTAPTAERESRRQRVTRDLRALAARRRALGDADTVVHAWTELTRSEIDLTDLDDADLFAYRARLFDLAARAMGAELAAAAVAASAFRRLEVTLTRHLGEADGSAAAAQVTSAFGVAAPADPRASAAVVAGPTWEELGLHPATVVERDRRGDDQAEPGDEALELLEDRLFATPEWARGELRPLVRTAALRRLVAEVVSHLRRRERTKGVVLGIGGELRRVHLELGARLVAASRLESIAQVDLLSDRELRGAWRGEAPSPAELARRARWLDRYESEGRLPTRFAGAPDRQAAELPVGDRFEGWATSPGRGVGPAVVVRAATEQLEPGSVLVAEATDASWSPLFVGAAGIVLERGGPLSHAAILARELGVPAVLNVAGATRTLGGHRVLVDGDAGVVVVLDGEEP